MPLFDRVHPDWPWAEATISSVDNVSHTRNEDSYSIVFTFKVGDGWFGGTFDSGIACKVGDKIQVQYDPPNPDHNDRTISDRRILWFRIGVVALIVLAFIVAHLF